MIIDVVDIQKSVYTVTLEVLIIYVFSQRLIGRF